MKHFLLTCLILGDLYFVLINATFRPKPEVIASRSQVKNKFSENSPIFYLKLASNIRQQTNKRPAYNLLPRKNSNLYKLPLKFVSNAKPVDIIQGISNNFVKKPLKVTTNVYKQSKVFYLPTKFISNAKPIKPIIMKNLGKPSKKKYHRHYHNYLKLSSKH